MKSYFYVLIFALVILSFSFFLSSCVDRDDDINDKVDWVEYEIVVSDLDDCNQELYETENRNSELESEVSDLEDRVQELEERLEELEWELDNNY